MYKDIGVLFMQKKMKTQPNKQVIVFTKTVKYQEGTLGSSELSAY